VQRLPFASLLLLAALLTGCGSSSPSPESVVRAWSQELNSGDNEAAAKLFAPGAEVVQAAGAVKLTTLQQAIRWNASLPCSGRIVSIDTRGDTATATFVLGNRQKQKCDGPGRHATAIFRVEKGKIVLWHQTNGASLEPSGSQA
jgi:limonene-1,2-epoxide hydrolase